MAQIIIRNNNSADQTRVMALRLPHLTFELLESVGARKQIKTSALANQAMQEHLNFCVPAKEGNMMPLSKQTINMLLEGDSDEKVAKVAASAGQQFADVVLTNAKIFDLEYFLQMFLLWMNESGIAAKHEISDGVHTIVLYHGMGREMSLYLTGVLKKGIEITDHKADFVIREGLLVSTIKQVNS